MSNDSRLSAGDRRSTRPLVASGEPPSSAGESRQMEPLADRAEVLEYTVEHLPYGVLVVDRSGSLLVSNPAAHEILGLEPQDTPSTDWARTYICYLADGVTPCSTEKLPLARALRGEEVEDVETLIRNDHVPDGRWIRTNAQPWRDASGSLLGALAFFRDVSDEKRSRDLNERLSNVVESTADSVFIAEADGTIVYVNPAFELTTGYSRDEALGSTPRLLRSGRHDGNFYKELWDTVLSGGVYRGTLINRKKNGELFHSEQTISPIAGADGRYEYLVSVAKDITERLRSERIQAQIEAGAAIQRRLYPERVPQLRGFDLAGAAHPAEFLCGDCYDFAPMPGGCLAMTIADVCGHGVGPSILMAQTRAYLRMLASEHDDVGEVLRRLNGILSVEGSQREFVTQILVRLDPENRTLVYANAGHPAGFLVDRNGELRQDLGSCDLPLGIFPDRLYPSSRAIPLELGDVVVLFTDGITECSGPDGAEFGFQRVLEIVKRHRHEAARLILAALFEAVDGFRSDGPQLDDMTAIVCKVEA